MLRHFKKVSDVEVIRVINYIPRKTSPIDYISTDVWKTCVDVFGLFIARLAKLTFREG